jgi:hypothetical protein
MNKTDIRSSADPDLAGSYAAMLRASRAAEDLVIQTNTYLIVSVNGQDMKLSAQDILKRREAEAKQHNAPANPV